MSALKNFGTSKGVVTYDVYAFLSEMRKRPILWDKTSSRTKITKDSSWYDFARDLVPHFDEIKIEEQRFVVEYFRKEWFKLTTNIMKTITLRQSGDENCRMNRFVRHMQFYLESRGINMEDVATEEDLEEADRLEKKHYEINGQPVAKRAKVHDSNTNRSQPCFDDSSFDPVLLCEANTEDGSDTQYDYQHQQQFGYNTHKEFKKNDHSTSKHDLEDPEQAFFDSLKPVLRKMNETQKLDFKIQTLKVLKKYQTV